MADKSWGQKINVPRDSMDKTVAIAKGEDKISDEGFYDANQWEYYHWTILHPNNKRKEKITILGNALLITDLFSVAN